MHTCAEPMALDGRGQVGGQGGPRDGGDDGTTADRERRLAVVAVFGVMFAALSAFTAAGVAGA